MDPKDLKQEFDDRITFWGGGCDTQNVLSSKTPPVVSGHVKGLVRLWKSGGGYIFNQVHNIQGDGPPEYVVSMLNAAYEESWY